MNPALQSSGSLPAAILATALTLAAAYTLGWPFTRYPASKAGSYQAANQRIAAGLILLAWLAATLGSLHLLPGRLPAALLTVLALPGLVAATHAVWRLMASRSKPNKSTPQALASPKSRHPPATRRGKQPQKNDHRQPTVAKRFPPKWLLAPAVLASLITLGPSLAYPTGWDELVYHHELPKRWLADGWPALYADLPYSGFPSAAELLFWLMSPLDGAIAPRLLMGCCWLLGLAATYQLVRTRLAPYSAAALTTAFALSGTLLMISANCYVESLLLLITATLLFSLSQNNPLDSRGPLAPRAEKQLSHPKSTPAPPTTTPSSFIPHPSAFAIGLLAGGAAAIKLTGLVITLLPLAFYILHVATGRLRPKAATLAIATYLLVAATIALPFYLRPYLLTGNPFYPYYAHWFITDPATLDMSRFHHALGANFGVHTAPAFFTAPLLLAVDLNQEVNVYDGYFGWQLLVILFLAVLALLELRRPKRRLHILGPALIAAACYTFWFFTAQQARFAIPAMLGATLLAASGLHSLHGPSRKLVLGLLLAATFLSLPYRNAGHYFGSWLTALGIISPTDYVSISTGRDSSDRFYIELLQALQQHTPSDARLLTLFEHRGFYFPRRYEIGTPLFQAANFTPPEEFGDPGKISRLLEDRRITHIVLTNAPAGPDQVPASFDRLEHFLPCFEKLRAAGRLTPLWSSERYLLLQVVPQP